MSQKCNLVWIDIQKELKNGSDISFDIDENFHRDLWLLSHNDGLSFIISTRWESPNTYFMYITESGIWGPKTILRQYMSDDIEVLKKKAEKIYRAIYGRLK